jgi:hypothetical protein
MKPSIIPMEEYINLAMDDWLEENGCLYKFRTCSEHMKGLAVFGPEKEDNIHLEALVEIAKGAVTPPNQTTSAMSTGNKKAHSNCERKRIYVLLIFKFQY